MLCWSKVSFHVSAKLVQVLRLHIESSQWGPLSSFDGGRHEIQPVLSLSAYRLHKAQPTTGVAQSMICDNLNSCMFETNLSTIHEQNHRLNSLFFIFSPVTQHTIDMIMYSLALSALHK